MKICSFCERRLVEGEWYLKCTPSGVPGHVPYVVCPTCIIDMYPAQSGMLNRLPSLANHVNEIGGASNRTVGMEFEGNWSPSALLIWRLLGMEIKGDGSLRGINAAEIVTPVYSASTYRRMLDYSPLDTVETYSRCGIHVWFGASDHSWQDANKMLFYCKTHERDIITMLPPTRFPFAQRDHGGRPMQIRWDPVLYATKQGFLRSLYGLTGHDLAYGRNRDDIQITKYIRSNIYRGFSKLESSKRCNDHTGHAYPGPANRTWWFNIHGYWYRRAYEVRLLHTTTSKEVVAAWTEFWLRLCDVVPTMTLAQLKNTRPVDIAPTLTRKLLIEPFQAEGLRQYTRFLNGNAPLTPRPNQAAEQEEIEDLLDRNRDTYIRFVKRNSPYIWTVGDRAGQNWFTTAELNSMRRYFAAREEKYNEEFVREQDKEKRMVQKRTSKFEKRQAKRGKKVTEAPTPNRVPTWTEIPRAATDRATGIGGTHPATRAGGHDEAIRDAPNAAPEERPDVDALQEEPAANPDELARAIRNLTQTAAAMRGEEPEPERLDRGRQAEMAAARARAVERNRLRDIRVARANRAAAATRTARRTTRLVQIARDARTAERATGTNPF